MNCEETERYLDPYLDRELELNQRLELEGHLSLCTSCWCLAQERKDSRFFFRSSAPTYKAPPELRSRVLATVRQSEARRHLTFLRHRWVFAAAAFVAGFVFGFEHLFPRCTKRGQPPGSFAPFPLDLRGSSGRSCLNEPAGSKVLVDCQTQFLSAGRRLPCLGILSRGRKGRCNPRSFSRHDRLQE